MGGTLLRALSDGGFSMLVELDEPQSLEDVFKAIKKYSTRRLKEKTVGQGK